jgi:hypothetical protein
MQLMLTTMSKTSESIQDLLTRAIASIDKRLHPTIGKDTHKISDILKVQPMTGNYGIGSSIPMDYDVQEKEPKVVVGWRALNNEQGIARVKELCSVTSDEIAQTIFEEICKQEQMNQPIQYQWDPNSDVSSLLDLETTITNPCGEIFLPGEDIGPDVTVEVVDSETNQISVEEDSTNEYLHPPGCPCYKCRPLVPPTFPPNHYEIR